MNCVILWSRCRWVRKDSAHTIVYSAIVHICFSTTHLALTTYSLQWRAIYFCGAYNLQWRVIYSCGAYNLLLTMTRYIFMWRLQLIAYNDAYIFIWRLQLIAYNDALYIQNYFSSEFFICHLITKVAEIQISWTLCVRGELVSTQLSS